MTLTFNGVTITPSGSSNGTCTFAGSTITTTAAGAFTCRFVIPIGASAGVGTLVANDPGPVQTASAAYTVSAWTLTLSPTTAAASVTITFTGAGFAAGSVVSIQYSGAAGNVAWHAACSTGTGAAGAYSVTVSGGRLRMHLQLDRRGPSRDLQLHGRRLHKRTAGSSVLLRHGLNRSARKTIPPALADVRPPTAR